jgi:hypothetical protein
MNGPIDFKKLRNDEELIITTAQNATLVFHVLKAVITKPDSIRPSQLVVELKATNNVALSSEIGERGTLTFAVLHGSAPNDADEFYAKASKTTIQKGDGVKMELENYARRYFAIRAVTVARKK